MRIHVVLTVLYFGGVTQAATFVNVTSSVIPSLGHGKVAWGDYNGDGFVDLYSGVSAHTSARGHVWKNNGGTSFTLRHSGLGESGVWGDANNDGWPDILSYAGPGTAGPRLFKNNAGTGFSNSALPSLPTLASRAASWTDHDNDGDLDLYIGGFESTGAYYSDVILRNDGGMSFSHTWTEPAPARPGRGIASADFDRDGDIDIYVSNYRLEPNGLYVNDGVGNFTDRAVVRGATGGNGHTIGSSWGDIDNDGEIDLFVGNFSHDRDSQPGAQFLRNTGPDGGYRFQKKVEWRYDSSGEWQESYASPTLGDYDNDGDLDLFFTTAYVGDRPRLYRNDGNWNFTNVTYAEGLSGVNITYAAGFADYDNDGDLDLLTEGKLFRNQGNSNHWLKVKLVGDGQMTNRDAVGAQVRIDIGDKTLVRQVGSGTGEGNQNDPTLHFGLGTATGPVDLDILWPGGMTTQVTNVAVDQLHTIPFTYTLEEYQWVPNGGGNWYSSSSWSPTGVPDGNYVVAKLTSSTASATIIQVNSTTTVHRLDINGDTSYRLIGDGTLQVAGTGDTGGVVVTGGDHRLAIDTVAKVNTTISITGGSSLTFPEVFSFDGVTVSKEDDGTVYFDGPSEPGSGTFEVKGGTVAGQGFVNGDLVMSSGTLAPGNDVGRLEITGDLTLGGSVVLELDIGAASEDSDFLSVDGTASLAGSLEVVLEDGYQPAIGSRFLVATADTIVDTGIGLIGPYANFFEMQIYPNAIVLETIGVGLAGDYNGNGIVDAADYVIWRDTLGSTVDLRADGDGNRRISRADYIVWKDRFGDSIAAGASTPIPESAAWVLVFVGLMIIAHPRFFVIKQPIRLS